MFSPSCCALVTLLLEHSICSVMDPQMHFTRQRHRRREVSACLQDTSALIKQMQNAVSACARAKPN